MAHVLGMDNDGPPDFPSAPPTPVMKGGLNNVEDLINAITQLQETVQNLQHQNHKLQDQMAAAQARGIMPAPHPWASPGVAPGVIHGVGMLPPIVNINTAELGAAIAHALLLAPAPQASRGPTAREAEPFDGKMENVKPFIQSCQIYIEIKQAQFASQRIAIMWILSYMTKGSTDAWREHILNQFAGEFEADPFTQVSQLYQAIEADFGDLNKRTTKVMALKKLRQGTNTCEEHIQAFKQLAWGSGYEGAPLIDEFKRSLHPKLRQKLMEAETPPVTIEDWY
jgi:cell division protein FtsB